MIRHLTANVLWAIAGVFALLVVASVIVVALSMVRRDRDYTELKLCMRSWWMMIGIFFGAIRLSPLALPIHFYFPGGFAGMTEEMKITLKVSSGYGLPFRVNVLCW